MYKITVLKSHAWLQGGKHSLWLLTSAALTQSRRLGVGGHQRPALRLDLLVGARNGELLPLEAGPGPLGALLQEHQCLAMMT